MTIADISKHHPSARNHLERRWCETGLPQRDTAGNLPHANDPERVGIFPSSPTPTWESIRELRSNGHLYYCDAGIAPGGKDIGSATAGYVFRVEKV